MPRAFPRSAFVVCALVAVICVRLLAVTTGSGSVVLTGIGATYSQDFNSLAASGTSSLLPNGWFFDETSTNANTLYNSSTGSNTAGDTYSFGSLALPTDRAFGTLQSGTLIPMIGAAFTNNTGSAIGSLDIAYTGEMWRLGTINRGADRLDFQYSLNATSLTTGTWTDVDALDFSSPDVTGAVGLRDGNSSQFRTAISSTIAGLSIPAGATIWIRWQDFNASGADDGLAVDDFSITPHANVGPTGAGSANPPTIFAGEQTLLTVTVTPGVPPASIASVVANLAPVGGSASQTFLPDGSGLVFTYLATIPLNITGSFNLNATITEAGVSGRTGSANIALTVLPAPPPHKDIHEIQGSGPISPFAGVNVETEGIVTARRFNNGFFIQQPDAEADADPDTSEGIFVFTASAPPAAAQVGNRVRVIGTVQEFVADSLSLPATEITSPTVVLLSTGNPLPAAVTLTATDTTAAGGLGQLERFEGMRVRVDTLNVIAPTQGSVNEAAATGSTNGVYYGTLPTIDRPFREPGVELPAPLPPGSPCCVDRFDGNPEKIRVDSNGNAVFGPNDTTEVMTGATVSNIIGVLDYSGHAYTILPDPGAQGTVSGLHGYSAVSPRAPHRFTIGTANLERFFDTTNDAVISDVAMTAAGYARRLAKVGLQICDVMRAPDVIGVEEVENLGVLGDIAAAANGTASCGGTQYAPFLFEGNDPGGIDDGFLVNLNRVVVNDVHQEGKDTTYVDPNTGQPALLNDRPPTVLRATIQEPGSAPQAITVIANHLRSLNGVDEDPGDGNRVRTKRIKQAEFLGHLIEDLQFAGGAAPVVAVGDFNAFEFSDGYADVIGTINGTPVAADHVVRASTDVPNTSAPLTDLITTDSTPNRYSYSFDGSAQSLDHALATSAAVQIFDHIEWGHSNADFPETLRADATRPERLSDHDPVVAYFRLSAQTTTTVVAAPNPAAFADDITFTATVVETSSSAPAASGFVLFSDGGSFAVSAPVAGGQASVTAPAASFGVGVHTANASFSDGSAYAPSSGSTPFAVIDVVAPVIASQNITLEANAPGGALVGTYPVTATDDVDGSVPVSCLPAAPHFFAVGATTVNCSASDSAGHTSRASFSVTVVDSIPPSAPSVTVTPAVLWPPNHKMVHIAVTATSTDTVSAVSCAISGITSSEPDNGQGDGDTANDIGPINGLGTSLRAERSGSGNGRVYTVTVGCRDASGNTSSSSVPVVVPRSQ